MPLVSNVLEYFSSISGLKDEKLVKCTPICEECLKETMAKLKSGVNPNQYSAKIEYLSATYAYYKHTATNEINDGSDNIKLGDVSVSKSGSNPVCDGAYKLYMRTLENSRDFITDKNFWFGSVVV